MEMEVILKKKNLRDAIPRERKKKKRKCVLRCKPARLRGLPGESRPGQKRKRDTKARGRSTRPEHEAAFRRQSSDPLRDAFAYLCREATGH